MFRSGLGKSVSVKQSSITKALSILGDEGDALADTGSRCSSPFDDIIIILFICWWYLTLTPVLFSFPKTYVNLNTCVMQIGWKIRQKGLLW